MGQMVGITDYWNKRADTYSIAVKGELESEVVRQWNKLLAEHIDFQADRPLRVLDVGTGPGFFAKLFAHRGCRVDAVDCSPDMLDRARANTLGLESSIAYHLMDATEMSFADNTFDVVVTRNLTWTLTDPVKGYREWHRVLKNDGILLNFDANWYSYLLDTKLNEQRLADQIDPAVLSNTEGCATEEQCSACEQIALMMPLTDKSRPQWDTEVLFDIGFSDVSHDVDVWKEVWDAGEKLYYATSPLFMVAATK